MIHPKQWSGENKSLRELIRRQTQPIGVEVFAFSSAREAIKEEQSQVKSSFPPVEDIWVYSNLLHQLLSFILLNKWLIVDLTDLIDKFDSRCFYCFVNFYGKKEQLQCYANHFFAQKFGAWINMCIGSSGLCCKPQQEPQPSVSSEESLLLSIWWDRLWRTIILRCSV